MEIRAAQAQKEKKVSDNQTNGNMKYLLGLIIASTLIGCDDNWNVSGKVVCYKDTVNENPVTVLVEENDTKRIVEYLDTQTASWKVTRQYNTGAGWFNSPYNEWSYSYNSKDLASAQGYLDYKKDLFFHPKPPTPEIGESPQFCHP